MKNTLDQTSEILDSLSASVVTIDKDFKITFINSAAEIFFGKDKEKLIGKVCKDVCRSDYCDTECPITLVLKAGKNLINFDTKMLCADNKITPVKLNAAILKNEDNEPKGGVLSFRPVSELQGDTSGADSSHFHGIIGRSKVMRDIFDLIGEVANSDASVFIQGETGTGKELIANAVQQTSQRKDKKFVKINCAVLPPQLLASELFGHIKGAFTDAKNDRIGRFEIADQGTIFLDEIAEMPMNMQTQLLRILQDGTFERLGESITRKVNVRIIAATNVDIESAIEKKQFRSDLFFRLNVIPLQIPPLRDRRDDLACLLDHLVQKYNKIYKKNVENIDPDALDILFDYHWPGNIREVENIIEYAFIRSKKNHSICICGLPPFMRDKVQCKADEEKVLVSELKSDQMIRLLERYNWNQSKVADILGVNRSTIWRKLKKLGIQQ